MTLQVFFYEDDAGFSARCERHGAWRWRNDGPLTDDAMKAAETSLKRHHSRQLRFARYLVLGGRPVAA